MVYLVIYKFDHHSAVSGYDRLAEYIPCRRITIPGAVGSLLRRVATPPRREHLKQRTGLLGYFPESRWLEWWTGLLARLPADSVFHFIYPENSYFFTAGMRTSSRAKFVATYHQPVAESRQFILNTEPMKKLDALILLAESQREFFEPIVGRERIFVVPHGIDVGYFTPSVTAERERRVVAVGSWLRDFRTLAGALELLERKAPGLVCDIVASGEHRERFHALSNVQFHSGISDEALRTLYRRASLSVLALTGAGANNALLESMACGLPIVASDLPAVREYTVPGGCVYVRPGDSSALAESVLSLSDDEKRLTAMGAANRKHAARFSWEAVAGETLKVYRAVGRV